MKKLSFLLFFCQLTLLPSTAQKMTLDQADKKARETLAQMTLDEKLHLIDGKGFDIQPIERLGIKKVHMYDGPIGVRGTKANNASYPATIDGAIAERLAPTNSTAYPASVMLAATWNPQLAHDYGYALGRDSRARGINIILGPGVNIYRSPRNSRNFEYMGEDPLLTSRMCVEYIKGVQENPGVIACVKHFAANNPESGRYDVSSDVDERTLQEIYLPPFRAAVTEGKVGSIMSSYNRIWGTWTSEHQWLMHDVLRTEWQFPFISMTDWGAAHHTDMIVKHGVDLEMPGGRAMTAKKIKPLLDNGTLSIQDIDQKVLNILRTCYYFDLYSYDQPDLTIALDNKENAEVAYNVAKEGFVLLKNESVNNEPILPINPAKVKKICITGHNALDYVSGGGSSIVTPHRKVSAFDAISEECKKQGVQIEYRELEENPSVVEQCCYADAQTKKKGIQAEYFFNQNLEGTPSVKRIEKTVASPWIKNPLKISKKENFNTDNKFSARYQTWVKVEETDRYLFSVSGDDGFRMWIDGNRVVDDWHDGTARLHTLQQTLEAGKVYPVVVEYFQSGGGCSVDFKVNRIDKDGMKRIKQELQQYDLVLVCEGFDKNLEAEGGDRSFELPKVREAVLEAVAQSGVPAVAIMNGGGNIESQQWEPRMKGLLWAWYAGQEGSRALADILFGKVNPSGKLPMTFERKKEDNPSYYTYSDQGQKHVQWTEGVFIGYRGYEKQGVKPLYPFGFGLSYTTFQMSDLNVRVSGDAITATVKVKNTGSRDGAEVVQLYVGKQVKDVLEDSPVLRPAKELKAFHKVSLKAGEEQTVTLTLTPRDLCYYDVNTHSWKLSHGKYQVMVGSSVADIQQRQTIEVNGSPMTTKREIMQDFLSGKTFDNYVPAVFFMHFPARTGPDAVKYHVQHLKRTGGDLLKIQFEQSQPHIKIEKAEDWQQIQPLPRNFYAPTIDVVRQVYESVGGETMVLPTVYSAFQTLRMQIGIPSVIRWAKENPEQMLRALRIYNDALLNYVRDCKALGIDGFFMPTQGGETIYKEVPGFYETFVRPFDMELMGECTRGTHCNILHICDWEGPYDDLSPFTSYPGQIVNAPNVVAGRPFTPQNAYDLFGRIVLGGLDRKGAISKGTPLEVSAQVERLLQQRPPRYMVGAECTIDRNTDVENMRAAIRTAHGQK